VQKWMVSLLNQILMSKCLLPAWRGLKQLSSEKTRLSVSGLLARMHQGDFNHPKEMFTPLLTTYRD